MKSRILRAGIFALEAAGLAVAAIVACAAFVFWRVQASPVDLGWASPAIRAAANAALFDGAVRDIETIVLSNAEEKGGYRLELANVRIGRREGTASAQLPHVDIVFFPADFLSGKAGPRQLLIDGAHVKFIRRGDRRLKLQFGEGASERTRVFQALTGGAYLREAFRSAELKNVSITFLDELTGRAWLGRGGAAKVERTPGGYSALLTSDFEIGENSAALTLDANYDLSTDVVSTRLAVRNAPVGDLIAVLFGAEAELLTSPISGNAALDMSSDGAVLSSRIDLAAGEGELVIGDWSAPISRFSAVADFDPRRNEFTVDRIEWAGGFGEGAVNGVVALRQGNGGKRVEGVEFDLDGESLTIAEATLFDQPLAIPSMAAAGAYDVGGRSLDIRRLDLALQGAAISGGVMIDGEDKASPAVRSEMAIDGALDRRVLLAIWPKTVAEGAREFVENRVLAGQFSEIAFKMDLKAGAVGADGALPDDAMALSFRADGASVVYAPGMTPLTKVAGTGLLRGNSFRFDAEKATVGKVRMLSGEVEIPVMVPKGAPAHFRFQAAGDAAEMLRILDEKPLAILSQTRFSPQQFSGPATARVEITRPNLRVAPEDSYRYDGVATFSNLSVESIIGDASLAGGKGRLELKTDGMVIKADASLGDAPVSIEWRQRFRGEGDKTHIDVTGVASAATADVFGIPSRQLVQGPVPFSAKAIGGVDALRAVELDADFTEAALVSEALGWMKPSGQRALGKARFAFTEAGTEISALSLDGEGISIAGNAAFAKDGALIAFDLPTFSLEGAADLALSGRRGEAGALALEASGGYLNASEILRGLIDSKGGGGAKTPVALRATIARVDMRAGEKFSNAALDYRRGAERIEALSFAAIDDGGQRLSVELTDKADSGTGELLIAARSGDVGRMLSGLFGLSSVKGGVGRLDFTFTPGAADAPRRGALEAHDLRIVRAPLLAKIFSVGSLTGLVDLVNGEGIELENATAKFSLQDGAVRVSDARATGPSVGITLQGAFDLEGERALALQGAVAPAYQVNSLLGKTPLIGELFVSRKGEGLLALSYDVSGPAAEPRVTVNPLSALAPGVLRRMFEGRPAEGATADEPN